MIFLKLNKDSEYLSYVETTCLLLGFCFVFKVRGNNSCELKGTGS